MTNAPKGFDDYISELVTTSGRGHDFLNQLYSSSVRAAKAVEGKWDAPTSLARLSTYLNGRLSKTKDVSSLEYIDFFERIYGVGMPMEGVSIICPSLSMSNLAYIGAIYFIEHRSSFVLGKLSSAEIQKAVTQIAFEQGEWWSDLLPMLEGIDRERPGSGLVDGIPNLLMNLGNVFTGDYDLAILQKMGGVPRIMALGIDLDQLCQAFYRQFYKSKLGRDNLPLAFAFLQDANRELMAAGAIDANEMDERNSKMILGMMSAWLRQKGTPPDYYRTLMIEMIPHFTKDHGSQIIPKLTRLLPIAEIVKMFPSPHALIEPQIFKTTLKKHGGPDRSYDLVIALGIEDLFTPLELNRLKGQKLESALGL